MQEFIRSYPNDAKITMHDFVNKISTIAQQRMYKTFDQWHGRNLHLALADDPYPVAYIANWLLERETECVLWLPLEYCSERHRININIRDCGAFLVSLGNCNDHRAKSSFIAHQNTLQLMADVTHKL